MFFTNLWNRLTAQGRIGLIRKRYREELITWLYQQPSLLQIDGLVVQASQKKSELVKNQKELCLEWALADQRKDVLLAQQIQLAMGLVGYDLRAASEELIKLQQQRVREVNRLIGQLPWLPQFR